MTSRARAAVRRFAAMWVRRGGSARPADLHDAVTRRRRLVHGDDAQSTCILLAADIVHRTEVECLDRSFVLDDKLQQTLMFGDELLEQRHQARRLVATLPLRLVSFAGASSLPSFFMRDLAACF